MGSSWEPQHLGFPSALPRSSLLLVLQRLRQPGTLRRLILLHLPWCASSTPNIPKGLYLGFTCLVRLPIISFLTYAYHECRGNTALTFDFITLLLTITGLRAQGLPLPLASTIRRASFGVRKTLSEIVFTQGIFYGLVTVATSVPMLVLSIVPTNGKSSTKNFETTLMRHTTQQT